MNGISNVLLGIVIALALTGCYESTEKTADNSVTGSAVVVDLNAVSKATGYDDVINKEMDVVNASLTMQLKEITVDLNKQLAKHKENFGKAINVEQQQQLQELLIKANQQLGLKQTEANQKSAQHKESLILAWREKIQPVVQMIANSKGADVVLVQSPLLMWFDSAIDITDEVMAELRANPVGESLTAEKVVEEKKAGVESKKKERVIDFTGTTGDMI